MVKLLVRSRVTGRWSDNWGGSLPSQNIREGRQSAQYVSSLKLSGRGWVISAQNRAGAVSFWPKCCLVSILAGVAAAQGARPGSKSPVAWTISSAPTQPLRPETRFSVRVHAAIAPGWHLYALEEPEGGPLETVIGLGEGDVADLLHVGQSQPLSVMDAAFAQRTMLFRGSADFVLQLQIRKNPAPGSAALHVLIRHQSCNDYVCLPPHTDAVEVPIRLRH